MIKKRYLFKKINLSVGFFWSIDTACSSINNFAQIIDASFLCPDDSVATQSVADFRHRFNILITSFTSDAQSSAEFPFMEIAASPLQMYASVRASVCWSPSSNSPDGWRTSSACLSPRYVQTAEPAATCGVNATQCTEQLVHTLCCAPFRVDLALDQTTVIPINSARQIWQESQIWIWTSEMR